MSKHDLLPGTLDMLVLRTLSLGTLHVYAIGQHIERASGDAFTLEHGSLYPALERLLGYGYVTSKWGKSPTGRKARYYSITASGRKQLGQEIAAYTAQLAAIARVLGHA
jgi:PadR family transcriptional regulator PadR